MSRSPNRLLGVVFGAVYILIGLLGFTVTSGVGFFATSGGLLLGIFEVNAFHNVAHLLIGAALLIGGIVSTRAAKAGNSTVGPHTYCLALLDCSSSGHRSMSLR